MNSSRCLSRSILWLAPLGLLGARATAQAFVQRVSLPNGSGEADAASDSPSISSDGRFVAFLSSATNLVSNDTNGKVDVFVRDRITGTTRRVSVASTGAQANNDSYGVRISGDGRFVFFQSAASNLVANYVHVGAALYAHELATGLTTRIDVATSGAQANVSSVPGNSSADGHLIAFSSWGTNLVPGDTNGVADIFVRDRVAGTTTRVNVGAGGAQANQWSEDPWISLDGRFVVFSSSANNLAPNDNNLVSDVFVRDLAAGTNELVTLSWQGGGSDSYSTSPVISGDGRYVAYESSATNLVIGDTNLSMDVFVRDRLIGVTRRASVDSAAVEGNQDSRYPSISGDGRLVVFQSLASNLIANDTNDSIDVFGFELATATTRRLSESALGVEGDSDSRRPAVNGDGRAIAFASSATTMVGDDDNAIADVFVNETLPSVPSAYCTAGTTTNGCAAHVAANSQPRVSGAGSCQIVVSGVEGQRAGIVFYGVDTLAQPWGPSSSFLCVKPPTLRTGVQQSGGTVNLCNGTLQLDWNAFQAAHPTALGAPWNVGEHVFVQAWFRDPPAPKSTSLSDALHMEYLP